MFTSKNPVPVGMKKMKQLKPYQLTKDVSKIAKRLVYTCLRHCFDKSQCETWQVLHPCNPTWSQNCFKVFHGEPVICSFCNVIFSELGCPIIPEKHSFRMF